MRARRARSWFAPALAGVLTLTAACAYFNTLYNAEKMYDDAQRTEARAAATQTQPPPPGAPNPNARQYEQVVEKCKSMIANYPDSKHVDDAMLLSAKALYALKRYDEAVAALDTLERRFPRSDLRDEAMFLNGKSLYGAKKYDFAALALRDFVKEFRKNSNRPEALYMLCTSLMELVMNDEAVMALDVLEKDHGRSAYRFQAQVSMADILARKELYEQSLAVYQRLSESRIPESNRYDVWLGMARVQLQVGDYAGAIATLEGVRTLPRSLEKEPVSVLLRGRALAAMDSTGPAIVEYRDVTVRFARGIYAAEAYYRLGIVYEGLDSLQTAQRSYQEVPRAYSGSQYAEDAIKRSSDIGRVLKLQETEGDDSPEAIAIRTFSMAEIQLFQFNSPLKAIPNYEKIVNEFPQSEYAPRSVYALGYIHGVMLDDSVKAQEWYDVLMERYPDTAQAQLAYNFYKGAAPPPPVSEWVQKKPSAQSVIAPPNPRGAPPQPMPRGGADVDSTRIRRPVPPDTTAVPARNEPAPADTSTVQPQSKPAPADTASAPADTSRGGG